MLRSLVMSSRNVCLPLPWAGRVCLIHKTGSGESKEKSDGHRPSDLPMMSALTHSQNKFRINWASVLFLDKLFQFLSSFYPPSFCTRSDRAEKYISTYDRSVREGLEYKLEINMCFALNSDHKGAPPQITTCKIINNPIIQQFLWWYVSGLVTNQLLIQNWSGGTSP